MSELGWFVLKIKCVCVVWEWSSGGPARPSIVSLSPWVVQLVISIILWKGLVGLSRASTPSEVCVKERRSDVWVQWYTLQG